MDEELDGAAEAATEDDLARAFESEDDEPVEGAAEEGEESEEPDEKPEEGEEEPSGRYKVTVKADNGEIVEKQVTFDELKAGFARHEDVVQAKHQLETQTRAIQSEAAQHVQKVTQASEAKLSELATLVNRALDVVSPSDLMGLAQSDPAAFALAQARQHTLRELQVQIKAEQEQNSLALQQQKGFQAQQTLETSKSELAKRGVTTAQVTKVYEQAIKAFGYTAEELAANLDWKLVLVLKDALAQKGLKDSQPHVAKKLREAPKLPPSKTNTARAPNADLMKRLRTKGASGKDLAALYEIQG